jgi:hypothetical protein
VCFERPEFIEVSWTKRDTFKILNVDSGTYQTLALFVASIPKPLIILLEYYLNSPHHIASFVLLKNTIKTQLFVTTWLTFATDPRALTDQPNQLGDNHPGWKDHRHDQSILSLLCKKWKIHKELDPSQDGMKEDPYIRHDRNKT